MLKKSCLDVHAKIIEKNTLLSLESIPHSDVFLKTIESMLGIEAGELRRVITILKESHYILSIEILKEDKKNDIKRVEGYVDASLSTIRELKNFFQKVLMDDYERQFHNRLMVHQIVKEIYSRGSSFVNTPLGQTANKAIMLEEYTNLIEKEFHEFTESWKEKKLDEIIANYETEQKRFVEKSSDAVPKKYDAEQELSRGRAVDSAEYSDYSQGGHRSMKKMVSIYGVEFFFRVNLRNYKFSNIADAVENREIDRKSDLKMLKEMIRKLRINMDIDSKLYDYTEEINHLERLVSRHI